MHQRLRNSILCTVAALFVVLTISASGAYAQNFENAPVHLRASDVLPSQWLTGVNYTIRSTVENDGFINTYDLDTLYGPLRVESTALLAKRIGELNALYRIQQLKGTSVYMNAAQQVATGPLKTAEGMVQDPGATVSGIASGIGKFFGNVSSAVTSSGNPYQAGTMNSVLGQAAYKRQYAYEFGVDPYTAYEPLQKALNDVAWTAAVGGLTVKAAFMAIPGGAGLAVGLSGTADSFRALVRDKTPAELAEMNQNTLMVMGVPGPSVQAFMMNTVFDPQEQTLLVGALGQMNGVANPGIYIDKASQANEESVAVFLRARAQLMQLYCAKTGTSGAFVDASGIPVIQTNSGKIVAIFPLDYVAWTPHFARKAMALSDALKAMPGVRGKELLINGRFSPTARKALESKGWKVEERLEQKLLGS